MYLKKSQLQNAADAAAIAGGWAYCNSDSNDKDLKRAAANDAADESVDTNLPTVKNGDRIYRVGSVEKKDDKFYQVELHSAVPVYFLSYFNGVDDTVDIAAISTTKIAKNPNGGDGSGGGSLFDFLFKFNKDGFESTNANQNPDDIKIAQIKNSSFYDGKIVAVGEDANSAKHYAHELLRPSVLDDFEQHTTLGDIVYAEYTTDANGNKIPVDTTKFNPKYCNEIEAQPNGDMYKEMNAILAASEGKRLTDNSSNKIDLQKLARQLSSGDSPDYVYNSGGINPNFVINGDLPAKKDKDGNNVPLYVIVDNNQHVNLHIKGDMSKNSRPIVVVYTGTDDLHIETNHNEFRGVICAPNATVHINDNGMNFYGSIIGNSIKLTGQGRYNEPDFVVDGGSGGGGSPSPGTGEGNKDVNLDAGDEDITWE